MDHHDGHRERLRERYLRMGLDAFGEHEVLELLLTYAIPRRDTKPIAYALLDHLLSKETHLRETLRTCRSDIGNLEVLFGFERTITLENGPIAQLVRAHA